MRLCAKVAGLAALCVLASACGGKEKPVDASVAKSGEKDRAALAIPVEAAKPIRGDISARFETNARIVAERRVDVVSEGIGKCLAVLAEEGQVVHKGDMLAELDKQEALAALNQAEVQVRQQRATLERAEKAWKAGLGPKIEYENAKFAHDQSQASFDIQKVRLNNLTIRAPIDGIVTRKNIQVGLLVTTGAPVFSIVDPTSYIVEINPPERDLPRLQNGQAASVTVDALPGKEFKAIVRRINPSVENGTVKATLDFESEAIPQLKEGAYSRVGLVMETHPNALLLPKDALLEENGRKYVFVVKPSSPKSNDPEWRDAKPQQLAERLEVTTGFENAAEVEIVSGLDDNSLVVTTGQHTLKPGAEVVVTETSKEIEQARAKTPDEALAAAEAERAKGKAPAAGMHDHF